MRKATAIVLAAVSIPFLVLTWLVQHMQAEPLAVPANEILKLNQKQASAFARLALKGIQKEYPNKPGDVLNTDKDIKAPRAMHPALF